MKWERRRVRPQCHLDKDYTKNSVYRNMYPVLFSLDMYKMSRPNVQKILYKNVQLVCLS